MPPQILSEIEYRSLLLRIIEQLAPTAFRPFAAFVRTAEARVVASRIAAILGEPEELVSSRLDSAVDAIVEELKLVELAAKIGNPAGRALHSAFRQAEPIIARYLEPTLGTAVDSSLIRARSLKWIKAEAAKYVNHVTETAREAIRAAVDAGVEAGRSASQIASTIRPSVGLTPQWVRAVDTYKTDLLRQGVDEKEASSLARKYAKALHRRRLLNIGRTEVARSLREAEGLMHEELAKAGKIDTKKYEARWVGILSDGKICEICYDAHDSRRELPNGKYPNGKSRAEGHDTNCRCQEAVVRKGEKSPRKPPFVKPQAGGSLRPLRED